MSQCFTLLYRSFAGQEPDVNCSKKSTDCTCEVSGFPLPIVSKIVNGRETLRIGQAGLTSIQQGEALFAFNAFGDDAFVCPVTMVPAKITTTATVFTTKSTTNATATTNSSTSHSATQTKTKSAKLTSKSTSSGQDCFIQRPQNSNNFQFAIKRTTFFRLNAL